MNLKEAVSLEIGIWRKAYHHQDLLRGCTFFSEPKYPAHTYWNLLYGPDNESILSQLDAAKAAARAAGVKAHYLMYGAEGETGPGELVSTDRYFYFKNEQVEDWQQDKDIVQCQSLDEFADIVGRAFNFDEEFGSYFNNKLTKLAGLVPSRHFAFKEGEKIAGTWSMFDCGDNRDFAMNGSINPEFHGQGKSHRMVKGMIATGRGEIITHTSSTALMEKGLPGQGFRELGVVRFYRL